MRYVLAWAFLLVCRPCPGELIDRIAAVVGNTAITESEVMREIRITAFLNGEKPDFSGASKRKTADRLVEQKLMKKEMEVGRYPEPSASEVDRMVAEAKKRGDLKSYGISEEDLRVRLLRQLTSLRFIESRFRPGIRISEEDIREEFETRIVPALDKSRSRQEVDLEDYREQIEQKLAEERVDRDLDAWLKEARSRTKIEFRQEVFQ